jgi:hypothetical protein
VTRRVGISRGGPVWPIRLYIGWPPPVGLGSQVSTMATPITAYVNFDPAAGR